MLAAAGATAWLLRLKNSAPEEAAVPVPLTSYPGTEATPSFSPDGTQVAFAWCKDAQGKRCNIYIKQIGVEPPFRVTGDPDAGVQPRLVSGWTLHCLPPARRAVKIPHSFSFRSGEGANAS